MNVTFLLWDFFIEMSGVFRPLSAGCNGFTSELIRFVPYFKQLQITWTSCAPMSAGMEKFVDDYLPKIR